MSHFIMYILFKNAKNKPSVTNIGAIPSIAELLSVLNVQLIL